MERPYYFSKYTKIVRMMAWVLRFMNNRSTEQNRKGEITIEEYEEAECRIVTLDIRMRFWIIGIRHLAKSVIAACTKCARFRSKPAQALTAPLPSERIMCTAPFQVSGVDLAGPLFLRNEMEIDVGWCYIHVQSIAVYI